MKKIILTQNQCALVDDSDYEWLNQWKWYAQNTKAGFYAMRRDSNNKVILMHRLILGIDDKKIKGDHIDRNGLNNQRGNLRIATHGQNMANRKVCSTSSSKYLGVHWNKRDRYWVAAITYKNKKYTIGSYKNEIEAALAYNKRATEWHGEFVNLNIII